MMACQREDMRGLPWFPLLALEIDSGFELLFWMDLETGSLGPQGSQVSGIQNRWTFRQPPFPPHYFSFSSKNGNLLQALITLPF